MNNEIKILVNTSTFNSNNNEPVANFINELIDKLSAENKKLKFKILKPMNGKEEKIITNENYQIQTYRYFFPSKYQNFSIKGIKPSIEKNPLNILKIIFFVISQFFSLLKICLSFKPDIVYCHWFTPQTIIGYIVCRILKIRLIFTSHGSDVLILNNLGKFGSYLIRKVTNYSYKYTAVSTTVLNEINKNLSEDLLLNKKFKVIPMGIDENLFRSEKTLKEINEITNFLFIGRLIDYKGLDVLLQALERYKDINSKFKLDILGTGTEEKRLKSLVKNLKLTNHVNFLGFVGFDKKIEYLQKADCMFVTSKRKYGQLEGGPLTLIEGFSLGKICIVSDSIGFVEHCNENNSIRFKSGSSKSLLDAILHLESLSSENKNKIIENAKETSKSFNFKNIASQHNDFLFMDVK